MFAWKTAPMVGGTSFLRKDIHKHTWKSPDGLTTIQIDHILINRKWGRSLQGQRGPLSGDGQHQSGNKQAAQTRPPSRPGLHPQSSPQMVSTWKEDKKKTKDNLAEPKMATRGEAQHLEQVNVKSCSLVFQWEQRE